MPRRRASGESGSQVRKNMFATFDEFLKRTRRWRNKISDQNRFGTFNNREAYFGAVWSTEMSETHTLYATGRGAQQLAH